MNSSTLRRLAADHAALRCANLPPHWLSLSSDSESSMPDDLTQLNLFLAGPEETPYSNGLWKVSLKLPEDYPKSPPKAYFRTRIWHPNVEENTGSICVDTLKRDWEPILTLRDVLITISCLLIQPNPDSALNSTAGHLLQDDYESFARQAKLMTSIHASIPLDLREASINARRRGEDPGTALRKGVNERPELRGKGTSLSSVIMKKLPQRIASDQSIQAQRDDTQTPNNSAGEDDNMSASKENDPSLSPSPVFPPGRRPTLTKRPLSDLPCPIEPQEPQETSCLSPSDQNIINNAPSGSTSEAVHRGPQLSERNSSANTSGRIINDPNNNCRAVSAPESMDAENGRPAKRICFGEVKEHAHSGSRYGDGKQEQAKPTVLSSVLGNVPPTGARKASAPSVLGNAKAGKPRVGLRRL